MGVSGSKSKTTNKPIYSSQIEGAANNINSAYNANKGAIQSGANQFGSILSSVLDRYNAGDPNIEAARAYNADVLSGKYLDSGNPYLQQMIDQTGSDVRNGVSASLGTRGLTGGSDYAGIIARELAKNSTGLRYQNYGDERNAMSQAVSQVPGLIAAENGILDPAFAAYDAIQAPVRAAIGAGSGVSGILGQYQTVKQKTSPGLGALLAQMAGNAASAYAGGGF